LEEKFLVEANSGLLVVIRFNR